jgi:hypothetical protein
VAEIAQALDRSDLGWNLEKAAEYDVSPQTWTHAVKAVGTHLAETVGDLLYRLHQAEAAVRMLKAGYTPQEGGDKSLKWSRDEPEP